MSRSMLAFVLLLLVVCQAQASISNCQVYRSFSQTQCLTCITGYYVDTFSTCSSCSPSCIDCNGPSLCKTCKRGSYNQAGICYSCMSNCAECSLLNYCTTCNSGYFNDLLGMRCEKCLDNCAKCSNRTTCNECDTTFKKTTLSNGIDACAATPMTYLIYGLIILALIVCLPCIICIACCRKAGTVITHTNSNDGYSSFHAPSNHTYNHHATPVTPAFAGFGNHNSGMPNQGYNSGMHSGMPNQGYNSGMPNYHDNPGMPAFH